jgi:hypothetical protein
MRSLFRWLGALMMLALGSAPASAQEPPPPIGPFVVDLRATLPRFDRTALLAESRNLIPEELPGRGLGLDGGAHVYLIRWRAITFGLGGQVTLARAHAASVSADGTAALRPVTSRLVSLAPQLSLNFGTGDGWSYLSGGIGQSTWSVVADGEPSTPADRERLRTINYGGGARWFARPHLAFTFDVRFHAIDPGTPHGGRPGSPRTTLLLMGAGMSIK